MSLLPACVCKELVQSWRRASSTKLRLEGELQERGRERTLRRNGDEATPAENPCGLGGGADSGRGTGCTRPGEEADKGGGFLSPASANLESENDKATASAAVKLGVCLPAFASRRIADGPTWVVVGSVMRAAISGNRADERSVNGKLCAVPQWEAVADNLDAPRIVDRHIDVHCGQRDVAPDTSPGFLADACDGALEG